MPIEPGPVFRFEMRRLGGRGGSRVFRIVLILLLGAFFAYTQTLITQFFDLGLSWGYARQVAILGYSGMIAGLGLFAAFLVAPIPAFGTFSPRRGKHMLPLLLVTRLTAREIVWQSFAACLIPGVCLLVVMLPFFTFLLEWWGLDPSELAIFGMTIVGTMVISVALAVAFSLWSRGTLSAALGTYAVLAAWIYGTLVLAAPFGTAPRWATLVNPVILIWPGQRRPPGALDAAVFAAGACIFTITLLEIASATFRRTILARDRQSVRELPRVLTSLASACSRRPAWWPRPALDRNPILWREWQRARSALGLRTFWLLYVIGAAIATVMSAHAYRVRGAGGVMPELVPTAGYEFAIGVLALAIQASLVWSEEKSAGREGLDLLLVTPLEAATIVNGKWWAVYRYILPVTIFPVLASLLVLSDSSASARLWEERPSTFTALTTVPLVLAQGLVYAAAFVSLGVLLATRWAKPSRAVIATVAIYVGVTLIVPTVSELLFLQSNRPLAAAIGMASPIAAQGAVIMTRFPGPYFGPPEFALPVAAIWLLVAAGVALVLHYWTLRQFDRRMGRVPGNGRRSGSEAAQRLVGRESRQPVFDHRSAHE